MIAERKSTRVQEALAANLRRLRVARHLSLSQLARITGTSKATLSGIERAESNPTVGTLAALARALEVSVGQLMEELPAAEVRVVRASLRHGDTTAAGMWHVELDSLTPASASELAEISLAARQLVEPELRATGSRAHVYVVQGRLIAGPVERITELGVGDYASFPVDVPHVYEAVRHAARALVLTQTPTRA
jgi:transcriptional regulator with XRE-family HTH domain